MVYKKVKLSSIDDIKEMGLNSDDITKSLDKLNVMCFGGIDSLMVGSFNLDNVYFTITNIVYESFEIYGDIKFIKGVLINDFDDKDFINKLLYDVDRQINFKMVVFNNIVYGWNFRNYINCDKIYSENARNKIEEINKLPNKVLDINVQLTLSKGFNGDIENALFELYTNYKHRNGVSICGDMKIR